MVRTASRSIAKIPTRSAGSMSVPTWPSNRSSVSSSKTTQGICGYALGAFDSRAFYARYEAEWRPKLCERFPVPAGDPTGWTRVQQVHHSYHRPDYFSPEPYETYPSHLHIDLLPRAQGRGYGRRMVKKVMDTLARRGSPGAHLGVSTLNRRAYGFYQRLGFQELIRVGAEADGCIYMGITL